MFGFFDGFNCVIRVRSALFVEHLCVCVCNLTNSVKLEGNLFWLQLNVLTQSLS